MPGCQSLTFEQPLAGGYRYRRVYEYTLAVALVGGADHHHRRQHDPLLYILFSADGRTTSSSLYISLKFPWKYISLKFLWKIPDSCRISTLLIVV
mmetsp:Transcript_9837/g.16411  ORF Transcript_9837/g.16411 Transcript_9837/m.16411 type:complete len:95 (-) Transcript_9837:423-707(-)